MHMSTAYDVHNHWVIKRNNSESETPTFLGNVFRFKLKEIVTYILYFASKVEYLPFTSFASNFVYAYLSLFFLVLMEISNFKGIKGD